MPARILDGKQLAEPLRDEVRRKVQAFRAAHGRAPGLDVVLVGDDPASVVYTKTKERASNDVGMRGKLHALPATITQAELASLVAARSADPEVDGILVQLPLPPHIDPFAITDRIDPAKDVDGLHPLNVGLLAMGRGGIVPATPKGCMRLLAAAGVRLDGARAVVIGRSNIVGKPMAWQLLAASATVTVTVAHSHALRDGDLAGLCRDADVLVVAVGKPGLVRGDFIKPGAVVIDVGITRVGAKLHGDVAFDEAALVASAITPVPGGVGPMTIACLLENTIDAALNRFTRRGEGEKG
jgi:methylenetetrahydrofolate dehydrogenase (NADP+)/methenyltetrahydrofolate cyclohydrolase